MEHDRLGVGVVEEVGDLLRAVPVVGVDRHHAGLERGDERLQVLDAVVQVAGDLRLVAEPGGHEVGGEGAGPPIELAPRDDPVALHLARPVGDPGGDGLVDVGEVPVVHASPGERPSASEGAVICTARGRGTQLQPVPSRRSGAGGQHVRMAQGHRRRPTTPRRPPALRSARRVPARRRPATRHARGT